jgi:hypothetical protein
MSITVKLFNDVEFEYLKRFGKSLREFLRVLKVLLQCKRVHERFRAG